MAVGAAKRGRRGRKIDNPARRRAINRREAINIANNEQFQNRLNADYDQLLLRVSNAVGGLRNGAPPPVVS